MLDPVSNQDDVAKTQKVPLESPHYAAFDGHLDAALRQAA